MFPQLLAITEQPPFWSRLTTYGHLLLTINLHKERHQLDSKLFCFLYDDSTTFWEKAQYSEVKVGRMLLKGDLHGTQFSHATCSSHDFNPNSVVFLYDRHARVYWLPPVGLSGFFQVYSPVRNENVITENLPTGFDLTQGIFHETEK